LDLRVTRVLVLIQIGVGMSLTLAALEAGEAEVVAAGEAEVADGIAEVVADVAVADGENVAATVATGTGARWTIPIVVDDEEATTTAGRVEMIVRAVAAVVSSDK
jgi:CO dehydrogenase/acetyl-CoA synthase alpha subunit